MKNYLTLVFALVAIGILGCASKYETKEAPGRYTELEEPYYEETAEEAPGYGAADEGREAPAAEEPVGGYEAAGGEIPAPKEGDEITFRELDTTEMTKDLMVIKTADVTYEVGDVDAGTDEVVAIVSKYNAFILDSHEYKDEYGFRYSSVTVRIKPAYFEKAIKDLHEGMKGTLINEQITGEDVTAEYVDLKARLDNKLEVQRRFNDYLDKETKTLGDIITVERELERIGEDVERLKGQLRYLENRVALSTITVNLQEPQAPGLPGGKRTFAEDIKWAFSVMLRIIVFLIQAFIILLPFIVILVVAAIIIRAIIVHYVRKRCEGEKG